jgi:hypothetical protein
VQNAIDRERKATWLLEKIIRLDGLEAGVRRSKVDSSERLYDILLTGE